MSLAAQSRFLCGPIPAEVDRALDRLADAPDVVHVAAMPDVHLAEDVCVGTVVATRRLIYPSAVGGDIGCGMAALRFDAPADPILGDPVAASKVLAALHAAIPFDRHRKRDLSEWPPDLDPDRTPLALPSLTRIARRNGRAQLGTLGSGNHFVELQRDDHGALWLMLHSGSRGMGQAIRDHHQRNARPTAVGLAALDAESPEGRAYLADVEWALRYADANRRLMVDTVSAILRQVAGAVAVEDSYVACHHNHVRLERHRGEPLWVHRKGAISARPGEPGIIPGSMGSPSVHVEGRGCPEALMSSSHGAGRVMSRTEARRRISLRDLERQLSGVWFDHRLANDLRDEAPAAYKDIGQVMRAQRDLTRTVRRLEPLLCFKGA